VRAVRGPGLVVPLLLLLAWGGRQSATAMELLTPPGCLPADGGPAVALHVFVPQDSACRGQVTARSTGGSFSSSRCLAPALFVLKYRPARLDRARQETIEVVWSRGKSRQGISRRVELCPWPAGVVKIRAEPDHLLAGRGQQAALHIDVFDSRGQPLEEANLRVTSNVGQVRFLRRVAPGRYQAAFLPPDDPFPQVAIIMVASPDTARLDRVAVGRAVIPITARVELPGKTRAGTRIRMKVAGRRFGPVTAARDGTFKIPILVPPGTNAGWATSIDRAGNRTSRLVNLFLPETNQLGIWAHPLQLPADGHSRARLLVTTVAPTGRPADLGPVQVKAQRGRLSSLRRIARGLLEAYYTAPDRVGPGRDSITVRFPRGGSKSRAHLDIELLPGQARHMSITAPASTIADGRHQATVEVALADERGNPLSGKLVEATAAISRVTGIEPAGPGRYQLSLLPPADPPRWQDELTVQVKEHVGKHPSRILVSAESIRNGPEGTKLVVCLVDEQFRPVPGTTIIRLLPEPAGEKITDDFGCVEFDIVAKAEGEEEERPLVHRFGCAGCRVFRQVYTIGSGDNTRLLPVRLDARLPDTRPLSGRATLVFRPAAPLEVLLQARRQGSNWLVRARVVGPAGQPRPGARITLEASSGKLVALPSPGQATLAWRLEPGPPGWSSIVLTATERELGTGAVIEIREGDR